MMGGAWDIVISKLFLFRNDFAMSSAVLKSGAESQPTGEAPSGAAASHGAAPTLQSQGESLGRPPSAAVKTQPDGVSPGAGADFPDELDDGGPDEEDEAAPRGGARRVATAGAVAAAAFAALLAGAAGALPVACPCARS